MRRLFDYVRYYFSLVADKIQLLLVTITVALTFLALIAVFVFMMYYLFADFSLGRVIAGSIALYTFSDLNKSLQGKR